MNRIDLHYLRRYRDETLAHNVFGRIAIATYERTSAALAPALARSKLMRSVLSVILEPFAYSARAIVERERDRRYHAHPVSRRIVNAAVRRGRGGERDAPRRSGS